MQQSATWHGMSLQRTNRNKHNVHTERNKYQDILIYVMHALSIIISTILRKLQTEQDKAATMTRYGLQQAPLKSYSANGCTVCKACTKLCIERGTRWLNWKSVGLEIQWIPMDSMATGSNPVRSTRTICESFSESKCCADSLSVCPTPVCIPTHKNDHVRTLKILWSMSKFGGLRKHEKTQHALC